MKKENWYRPLMVMALALPAALACGSSQTPVNIHGINYSNQDFRYQLLDPSDPKNVSGGELVDRFAAGGTTCCFNLPNKWQPGLSVRIDYVYYLQKKGDGVIPEIKKSIFANIPRYVKPAEIWVVRNTEGVMTIVLSDYQPNHSLWPGKIKGWPVASIDYKRERIDLYINQATVFLKASEALSNNMKKDPDRTAKEAWDYAKINEPKNLVGFNGYQDKKYHSYLLNDYQKSVIENRKILSDLEKSRP